MRKRELLFNLLRWLLGGDRQASEKAQPSEVQPSASDEHEVLATSAIKQSSIDPQLSAMSTPEIQSPQPAAPLSADQFPKLGDEIRDLLASEDWEEVNQGLELLVSSLGEEAIQPFGTLIDVSTLRVAYPDQWQFALGISLTHEINAVAKLAELSGALKEHRSIRLNKVAFADEIQIDLTLLSGASSLEELIINGGTITGLAGLNDLHGLRYLALMADSIDWDADEHSDLFKGLTELCVLCLSQWPWEDLSPLFGLSQLERLDLRGGELSTLDGLEALRTITSLSLKDFYSLSSVSEIGNLELLSTLRLLNLSFTSLEGFEGLDQLSTIELEASDRVDVAALGSLPRLDNVRFECGDLVGLGALAAAANLRQLKLSDIPEYCYDESSAQRFGRREMDRLCKSWKAVQTSSKHCNSSLSAKGADLPVLLIGLNVMETLAGQIDANDFSSRLEQLSSRWGEELRSRAYWPKNMADGCYSHTAPIGQWLNRAKGSIPSVTLDHIAEALAKQLPESPQRA